MKTLSTATGLHRPPIEKLGQCPKHGQFVDCCYIGKIWIGCAKCEADADAKQAADDVLKAKEAKRASWQASLGVAAIPERFADRSLQAYKATNEGQKLALRFAEDYANNFTEALACGRCAVFLGKPGTGKTHIAIGIALRVMSRDGRAVLFSTVLRFMRRVKGSWGKNALESEAQVMSLFSSPDLLILDEVGVQFGSETEKQFIFDLLNDRYENRRPTILITNLAADEFKAAIGERVADRLREDGGVFVAFDWSSWRGAT